MTILDHDDHPGGGPALPPAVELRGISKRFGPILACDDVSLDVQVGEIHGLLGQNGAGKSTVAKILVGLYLPDSGTIDVRGEPATVRTFTDSIRLGIGMVHQHFSLIDNFAVWENVALGEKGSVDPSALRSDISRLGDQYGLPVDPDALVGDLSFGQRQRVEILKCLRRDPKLMIFDEPTSSLSADESRELFGVLKRVVIDEGRSIILISHKLDEIMRATDRVTVMRNGRVVARHATSDTEPLALARDVVGREVSLRTEAAALGVVDEASGEHDRIDPPGAAPTTRLKIIGATAEDREGRVLLAGLDLEVPAGQITGIAGVEGNGQRPLGDLLSSLLKLDSGRVEVNGRSVPTGRPGAMGRAGIGIITEDRHRSGCVLNMTVAENLVLGHLTKVRRFRGVVDSRAMRARAEDLIAEFEISTPSPDAPMWSLSGGNQQRVVLARELSSGPAVLVAAQPTVGLDVGAIEFVNDRLRRAANDGVAVLLISTELEEVMGLADEIAVVHAGRVIGRGPRREMNLERISLLMGGRPG